jgi:hypothetical protein
MMFYVIATCKPLFFLKKISFIKTWVKNWIATIIVSYFRFLESPKIHELYNKNRPSLSIRVILTQINFIR